MSRPGVDLVADLSACLEGFTRMGCRAETLACLRGLISYTRERGPVGSNLSIAADFICEADASLDRELVLAWLLSTHGLGVAPWDRRMRRGKGGDVWH